MRMEMKGGSRPPWVGLGAAVWIQLGAGNAYTFPLYSSALKSVLGLSQQQLTILGVANDIGENVGILPGIACNYFPPWMVLACGAACCLLGYGLIWLALTQTLSSLPYFLLWISLVVAANSNAWFGTTILVTNMRNFPRSRGTIAGILKGYSGVSAQIFTAVFSLVLNSSAPKLLLFLTVGIPSITLTMMSLIRPCTPASGDDPSEPTYFLFTQVISIFLGLYLLATTAINDLLSPSNTVCYAFTAVMILLMLSPLGIPVKMTLFPSRSKDMHSLLVPLTPSPSEENCTALGVDGAASSSNVGELLAIGEGAVKKKRLRRGDDFDFSQALVKADFWLLWVVYFVGVGTGVTVVNNLAQIGYAQGVEDTTLLLSLFSFGNFLGRLSGGAISEHFVRSRTVPRTVWMTLTQLLMLLTFLVYATALSGTLYPATFCIGTCFGAQFAVMIPTVSELFGLRNFGLFYNLMLMGNPLGALLFSGCIAGYLYDVEATKQGTSSCSGAACFGLTFYIMAGVCGFGSLLSVVLTIRIRPVYKKLYGSISGMSISCLH
ncbi:hypothetical protein V2J09_022564 [Rumex salicifolius]